MWWRQSGSTDFDFKISLSQGQRKILSDSTRMGQSAAWHNWLGVLCQRRDEVLFLFPHTAEPSLQNFAQITDEQLWRFKVVWQTGSLSMFNPSSSAPFFSMNMFWHWMHNSGSGDWNRLMFACVWVPFSLLSLLSLRFMSCLVYSITFWPSVAVIGEVCWEMKL